MENKHIRCIKLGKSRDGELYVRFSAEVGGRRLRPTLRVSELEKNRDGALQGYGLLTVASRAEFLRSVQEVVRANRPTFRVVNKPGWDGLVWVQPDGTWIGGGGDLQVCLPVGNAITDKFQARGTPKGAEELARLAVGNPELMLAIALAFTGPIATMLQLETPTFQLVGEPASGKSVVAAVAGSVHGGRSDRRGFAESWSSTVNAIEMTALAHNASFLVLDELMLAREGKSDRDFYEIVRSAVMRVMEGHGRARLTDPGPVSSWITPVLSTSNVSLDDLARRAGIDPHGSETHEAARQRMIDVPFSGFSDLHGRADQLAFAQDLRASRAGTADT